MLNLSREFFNTNRVEFMDRLPNMTTVFIYAGTAPVISSDTDGRFLPDRNFFYLTGLEISNSKLVLSKKDSDTFEAVLFIPEKDSLKERWTGKRKTAEEVALISGIPLTNIMTIPDYEDFEYEAVNNAEYKIAYDGSSIMQESKDFVKKLHNIRNENDILDIKTVLSDMRTVKKQPEIDSIIEAAKITEAALEEMKTFVRPGATEVDLYTALEYGMSRRGSLLQAFETITAIGENAFYLHHSDPEGPDGVIAKIGDSIQIDVGARVNGYCADISRAYFVGDKQGEEDKRFILLNLIQTLRKEAWNFIKPGETFKTLNEKMYSIVGPWLVENKLIDSPNGEYTIDDVRKYYWHNTSHYLGLDVHDTGDRERAFTSGVCLAVEPGVYIPEWGVGFRIEDDVLVTDDGCKLLSSGRDNVEDIVL